MCDRKDLAKSVESEKKKQKFSQNVYVLDGWKTNTHTQTHTWCGVKSVKNKNKINEQTNETNK